MSAIHPETQEPNDEVVNAAGSIFGGIIVATSLIMIAVFCFSLLGRYSFAAEIAGNFRGQILVLLLPCAIAALLFRRWYIGMLLFVCTAWCSTGVLSVYLPTTQPPPGDTNIRIMSFNVLASNRSYQKVKQQIANYDPDVLLVVEYSHEWHQQLQSLIDDGIYPHHHRIPRWHGFGAAIFSKLPLANKQVFQLTDGKTDVPMSVCEIEAGDKRLRLAGMHVLSPTSRYRMELRNQQFKDAAKILSARDVPTIVAGDFNCAPWSPFLSDFRRETGYRDSRQGFGFQGTWNAQYHWPALIPIDHAFVSHDIHIHNRFVGQAAASDHFPIVLDISIRP